MAERMRWWETVSKSRLWEEARLHIGDMVRGELRAYAARTENRRKTADEVRDIALQFIRIGMTDTGEEGVARANLLQMYDDALNDRDNSIDLFRENRIATMFAIMYASGGDDETRRQSFIELGLSGKVDRQLNFQEARRFFIMWLFIKKYGKAAWEFAADAWESIADYVEDHPTGAKSFLASVLDSVMAEIREDRGRGRYDESAELYEDKGSYRADIREWMQEKTAAMQEAHEERLAHGDEETYTTRRGDAEIVHRRVRKNRTTLYAILTVALIFGIVWLFG